VTKDNFIYLEKTEHINMMPADEANYIATSNTDLLKVTKELLFGKRINNISTADFAAMLFDLKSTQPPIEIEISYTKSDTSTTDCNLLSVRKIFYIQKEISSSAIDFNHINNTLAFYANSKGFNLILEKNGLFWLREQLKLNDNQFSTK
jgi:hypothetical protein